MCGVFGVVVPGAEPTEAAAIATLGLFALQHRGQESAGVAVSDGEQLMLYKDLGMISTVLDERSLPSLRGTLAIAHCRYSTTGSTIWENAQPTYRQGPRRSIAIGHNGNLVNTRELLTQLQGGRARLPGLDRHRAPDRAPRRRAGRGHGPGPAPGPAPRPRRVQPRDPRPEAGHRRARPARVPAAGPGPAARHRRGPVAPTTAACSTTKSTGWCLSSETASLDIVGAEFVRDVEPGEIVILEPGQAPRFVRYAEANPKLCVFELIYFARPDSYMEGRNLYEVRRRMGEQLALEHPVDADLVMPVPDTGRPGRGRLRRGQRPAVPRGDVPQPLRRPDVHPAVGRAAPSGRDHQAQPAARGRGRQEADRRRRLDRARARPRKRIVELLRKAGATEVHVRISAPPIYHPCFYGIDTSIETELIASTHTEPEIREFIGADSLGYLSIRGVLAALELPYERFCFACFDGNYPEPVPYDAASRKFMLEETVVAAADRA